MFDCLAACNNVCVTYIWCMLLSTCYPKIIGALGSSSRKDAGISENGAKISRLSEYSLDSANGKVSSNPGDLTDRDCRRITIPRPPSKETM